MAYTGQVLALLIAVVMQLPGSTQRGDSMSGLIVGQVVDGETGRPVNAAIVFISGPPGIERQSRPVLTGSDGRFVFRGLRRGNYTVSALRPGYVDGAHGRTRPGGRSVPLSLADGQRTDEALIRMWKHASISGTVVDESGERLVGVRVQAYRRTVISGRWRFIPSGTALTDDRGVYRVGGLIPGDYIVGAVARRAAVPLSIGGEIGLGASVTGAAGAIGVATRAPGSMLHVRDSGYMLGGGTPTPPPPAGGRLAIYPPTFHPNAASGDAAQIVPVRPGGEYLGADVQLTPVPTVSIAGQVVGPEGAVTMTPLRLIRSNTPELALDDDSIATMTDRAGRFTFPAVPTGHYTLRLLRGAPPIRGLESSVNSVLWTDLPVSVGNEDIEHFVVEAMPGVHIGGRVEFESQSRRQTPPGAVVVAIEPADPISPTIGGRSMTVRVDRFGEFRSSPLPGGRYYVRVPNSPSGWMFKSATADGRDVADTAMTIAADALNVIVTFTDRWSGLGGFVQNRRGADSTAAVLVFPTDSDSWASSGANQRRVRTIRTGKNGEYSVNLPPGDYYAIAVSDQQTADWQDPAFLDAASRAASRVTIAEGERKTLDLRTRDVQ